MPPSPPGRPLPAAMLACLLAATALAAGAAAQDAPPTEPASPAATIWYLGHCGYAVRTAHHILIFDYIELEESPTEYGLDRGFVDPAALAALSERDGLDVTVFVSHEHVDHYDPVILAWRETVPDIRYVFGWGFEEGPGRHCLATHRTQLALDGLSIRTVNSHHAGVPESAFLVEVDGLALFHAGDYQGRPGRGEPSRAVADMAWLRESAPSVDLLFLGAWTGDPYLDVIRGLEPGVIFPMHDRQREERYRDFAETLRGLGFAVPVVCPARRGDRFTLAGGVVRPG
jgi:L-ascorbate metabolism protein UlaG (beta-lactamase superfamily)